MVPVGRMGGTRHGVDDDFALLICACTAAHVAGPGLFFGGMWQIDPKTAVEIPAPTVISTAGDTGFERAVRAATASLLPIQRELLAQYGEPVDEPVHKDPSRRVIEMIERKINDYHDRSMRLYRNPARDMDPDKQPGGRVRFILEGALPAKPVRFLKNYHLYTALAVGGIERLPRSIRWREARVNTLSSAVGGFRHGACYSIRGFMRFSDEDLEWMAVNIRCLLRLTLPVESMAGRGPVPPATGVVGMREFDRLHRTVLRRVLSLRFSRADCAVDFRSGGAERWFRKLREGYWAESGIPTSPAASVAILPDLFVWYFLQLGKSAWLEIDEMEVASQAVAAARRLRRRVAGFHDRLVALRRARVRLALAMKLVARMGRLDRASGGTSHGGSTGNGWTGSHRSSMRWSASGCSPGAPESLPWARAGGAHPPGVDDFMEALTDVPHSLTRKLAAAEELQAAVTATTTEPRN